MNTKVHNSILDFEEECLSTKTFWIMVFIAYLFAVAVRMIWVYQFQGEPTFYWNGQLMINTNDGYWYAEGARDILAGHHEPNDLSPVTTAVSIVTAFLAKILPVKFETLILYLPAFFGSLLVVPVMLIARIFNLTRVGFITALLAGIAWSYYNRTMTGYYDSDMLNIVLPTFVLWSIMFNISQKRNRYLPLIAIFMILYTWWYPQSYSLHVGMAVMVLLYTLVFERKSLFNYKVLIVMLIAMSMIAWSLKLLLVALLFLFFHFKRELVDRKSVLVLLGASFLLLIGTGGIDPIVLQIKGYLFRETSESIDTSFHYYGILKTVREAGQIPFEVFANRISGHTVTFILSTIGYILFAIRYPLMWLALPMIGLGFLALKSGLRFTVYAVPINALGLGYLIVWLAGFFKEKRVSFLFATFATVAALTPNILHVINYKVPTVFNKNEVATLDRLGKIAQREDYVLAWWDYGYPIRYYANVKTLIDGGKHLGDVNFPVSFALGASQQAAVNMARLDTEYTEKAYEENLTGDYLSLMMKDYNYTDPEAFLHALEQKDFPLPQKSRDLYFYLPYKMMGIFPTVLMFSNIDLKSGAQKQQPFFYYAPRFKDTADKLYLGQGIVMDKKSASLQFGNNVVPLKRFVTVGYDQEGHLRKQVQTLNPNSTISIIYMQSYSAFLVLDEKMYSSSYIQLFVLENYDKDLFEPVVMNPYAKIYRIKK